VRNGSLGRGAGTWKLMGEGGGFFVALMEAARGQ